MIPLVLTISGIGIAMAMGVGLLSNSSPETFMEDGKILMIPLIMILGGMIFWLFQLMTPENKVTQKDVDDANKIESKKILQKYKDMEEI